MKKLISLIAAAAMFTAISSAVIAEGNNNPSVYVNGREILFDDQAAVITEGRTLVPARGVFEAMGAKVEWDGEKRQVEVTSADENTIVRLVIDDANMKTYDMSGLFAAVLAGQDFNAPETVVELDVPAQIMSDRTMVPLRAISEAMDAQVDWNGEDYRVDIGTADYVPAAETAPELSLSVSADKVAAGETVDVLVNVKNIPADTFVRGIEAAVYYDKKDFEVVGVSLVGGADGSAAGATSINPDYAENCVRASCIVPDAEIGVKEDGAVMKITFKSITGNLGTFHLVDAYQTRLGYTNSLLFRALDSDKTTGATGDALKIDDAMVYVNAENDDPEATADPEATPAPEVTAAPEA